MISLHRVNTQVSYLSHTLETKNINNCKLIFIRVIYKFLYIGKWIFHTFVADLIHSTNRAKVVFCLLTLGGNVVPRKSVDFVICMLSLSNSIIFCNI